MVRHGVSPDALVPLDESTRCAANCPPPPARGLAGVRVDELLLFSPPDPLVLFLAKRPTAGDCGLPHDMRARPLTASALFALAGVRFAALDNRWWSDGL